MTPISERLREVRERIDRAARRSGRTADDITIVAISKTFPVDAIIEAAEAGVTDFGENKAQEFAAKVETLGQVESLRWHFVGHLQRNKVKLILGRTVLFHALDSVRLANAIQTASVRMEAEPLECLVQVNVSGEDTKFGVAPSALADLANAVARLDKVRVRGLMTLAAPTTNEDVLRRQFAQLRELGEILRNQGHPEAELLSMGMSGDFELAIEEGATHVRIGSAVFGPRACAIGD